MLISNFVPKSLSFIFHKIILNYYISQIEMEITKWKKLSLERNCSIPMHMI